MSIAARAGGGSSLWPGGAGGLVSCAVISKVLVTVAIPAPPKKPVPRRNGSVLARHMLREVEAPADEALNHTESEAYCAVGRPVGHSCPRFAAQLGHVVRVCRRRPQLCREPIASWQRSVRAHARDFVLEGVTQSMLSLLITQLLDALPHHAPGSPHAQGARPG